MRSTRCSAASRRARVESALSPAVRGRARKSSPSRVFDALLLCKALFLRLDFGDGIEIPYRAQLADRNLGDRCHSGDADVGICPGSQGHAAEAAEKAAGSAEQAAEGRRRS